MLQNFDLSLEIISLESAEKAGVRLVMVRADQVSPLASGNKLYKLLPTIEAAQADGYQQLLSFGGAFSNHLHALALYAESVGLSSVGIVRGEAAYASNPTLRVAMKAGMRLHFVDRATYKRRDDADYLQQLQQQFPNALIIPEGGSNTYAVAGCTVLMQTINQTCLNDFGVIPDYFAAACGTGTTFAGLVRGAEKNQQGRGYLVLKDPRVIARVSASVGNKSTPSEYEIVAADYGGYAKFNADLLAFILQFLATTGILLDPIYTSKMCRCLVSQVESGEFASGSTVVLVHSGGLQAWYGMKQKVVRLAGDAAWDKISNALNC